MTIVLKGKFTQPMGELKAKLRRAEQAYRRESKKLSQVDAVVTGAFHRAKAHYDDLKTQYQARWYRMQRR